jgi:hypothetical protein
MSSFSAPANGLSFTNSLCMLLFKDDDMRTLPASSLKTATLDQSGWQDTSSLVFSH